MARIWLVTATALLICLPAAAQDTKFVSSHHSPLKQAGLIPPNEIVFSGRAQVSGTFIVVWEPGSEGYPGYFRILLRPDARGRAILPHDSQRGPVKELWLRNTDVALKSLIGSEAVAALRTHPTRQITGVVTAVIGSYRTGVDCDQRAYNALLIRVVKAPTQVAAAPRPATMDGC